MKLDWVQYFNIDEDDHAWKQWQRLNTAYGSSVCEAREKIMEAEKMRYKDCVRYCKSDIERTTEKLEHRVAGALGRIPTPKRIIVNEESKVTVVLWEDGDKTIVRMCELDEYDPYAAYCAAFAKKCYGTNSKLKKTIERLIVYQEFKPKKGEKE